jgi:hypothetical protein
MGLQVGSSSSRVGIPGRNSGAGTNHLRMVLVLNIGDRCASR